MTYKFLTSLCVFALFICNQASAETAPAKGNSLGGNYAGISAAVTDYFEGFSEADESRLFKAFSHEHACMVGATRNKDNIITLVSKKDMGPELTSWTKGERPAWAQGDGEILSINIVDDRLAVVLFRNTDQWYDALTLAKTNNGRWKIISKAYIEQ